MVNMIQDFTNKVEKILKKQYIVIIRMSSRNKSNKLIICSHFTNCKSKMYLHNNVLKRLIYRKNFNVIIPHRIIYTYIANCSKDFFHNYKFYKDFYLSYSLPKLCDSIQKNQYQYFFQNEFYYENHIFARKLKPDSNNQRKVDLLKKTLLKIQS